MSIKDPDLSMHDITRFDSIGARFQVYMRELERLATELPDYLEVLEGEPDALALNHVKARLKERLDAIREAGKATPLGKTK